MPKVSLVIPHVDRSELLKHTIQSVESQLYDDWEAIIVDDGSSAAEWDAIQAVASDRVHVLRREDGPKGPSHCRNLGAAKARGDYLIFLDSDDLLAEFCILQRLSRAQGNPDADLWVFPVELFRDEAGDLDSPWNRMDADSDDLARFLQGDGPWCISSPLWRRQAFLKVGGFNEQVFYGDDAELHIRALLSGFKILQFPEAPPDTFIRRSDASRVTNSKDRESMDSRLARLEEVSAALVDHQVEQRYLAMWEGQYFVEGEFLLFNEHRPHDAIRRVLDRWGKWYRPSRTHQWLVRSYFALSLLCLKRLYLVVRVSRRLAMLLLPVDYFPTTRETGGMRK